MECMFLDYIQMLNINLSNFVSENLLNIKEMFYGQENLEDINLSSFDLNDNINMIDMFSKCFKLKNVVNKDKNNRRNLSIYK